jgi:hypothetical protein
VKGIGNFGLGGVGIGSVGTVVRKLTDDEIDRQASNTFRYVGVVLCLRDRYVCNACKEEKMLNGFDQHDLADLEAWLARHRRCGT